MISVKSPEHVSAIYSYSEETILCLGDIWYHNQCWFNSWLAPAKYIAWDKVLVAILS